MVWYRLRGPTELNMSDAFQVLEDCPNCRVEGAVVGLVQLGWCLAPGGGGARAVCG